MRRTRLWVGLVLCGLCVVVGLSGVAGGTASGPTAPVVGSPEWPGDAGDGAQVGAEQFRRQFVGNDRPDPPLADAGLDRVVEQNETVYLDASGSVAPAGRLEAYEWTIDPPQGSSFAPACRTCEQTEFVPRRPGRYAVTVTVTDSAGGTATDTLYVSVGERTPPDATLAGPTRLGVGETGTFTLDAQPRTHPLLAVDWLVDDTYRESFFVEAVGAQARRVSFANPGRHTVSARVVDESGSSGTATAEVLVGTSPSPPFTVTIDRVRPPRDTGNDTLTLRATVTNTGNATGEQDIRLERAGVELDRFRNLRLAPGESRTVTLLWADAVAVPGEHTLRVETDNDSDARTVQVGRVEEVVLNVTTRTLGTLDGVYANETVPVRADLVYYNGTTRTVPVSSSDALTLEASGSDPLSVRGGTLGSTYTPGLNDTVSLTVSHTANGITRTSDPETVRVFDPIQNVTTRVDRTGAGLPGTPFDDSHLLATGTQSYPLETTVTLAGGAGTRPLAQIAAAGDDDDLYTVTAQRDSASLDPYGLGGTYSLEPTQATAPGSPIEVTTRLRPAGVPATRPNHTAVASAPASAVAVTNATVDITAEDILVDETTTVRITTTLEQTHPERDGRRTGPATNFTVENTTFDEVVDETGPITLDTTPLANGSYTLTGTGNGNGTVTLTIEASQTPYLETGNVTASDTVGVGLPKYDGGPRVVAIPGTPKGDRDTEAFSVAEYNGAFTVFTNTPTPLQLYLVYPYDAAESTYADRTEFARTFSNALQNATGLPSVRNASNVSSTAWHGLIKDIYKNYHDIKGVSTGGGNPFGPAIANESIRKGYALRLTGTNAPLDVSQAYNDTLLIGPRLSTPFKRAPRSATAPAADGRGLGVWVDERNAKPSLDEAVSPSSPNDLAFEMYSYDDNPKVRLKMNGPLGINDGWINETSSISPYSLAPIGFGQVETNTAVYNNVDEVGDSVVFNADEIGSFLANLYSLTEALEATPDDVRENPSTQKLSITEGKEFTVTVQSNKPAVAAFNSGIELKCPNDEGRCGSIYGDGDDSAIRLPYHGIDWFENTAEGDVLVNDKSVSVQNADFWTGNGGTYDIIGDTSVTFNSSTMDTESGADLTAGQTVTLDLKDGNAALTVAQKYQLGSSKSLNLGEGQQPAIGLNFDNWKVEIDGRDDEGGGQPAV